MGRKSHRGQPRLPVPNPQPTWIPPPFLVLRDCRETVDCPTGEGHCKGQGRQAGVHRDGWLSSQLPSLQKSPAFCTCYKLATTSGCKVRVFLQSLQGESHSPIPFPWCVQNCVTALEVDVTSLKALRQTPQRWVFLKLITVPSPGSKVA